MACHDNSALDKIDIEMFFSLLAEKIGKEQLELVAAAMAESVARGGVARVLGCTTESHARIAQLRKRLRNKLQPATMG